MSAVLGLRNAAELDQLNAELQGPGRAAGLSRNVVVGLNYHKWFKYDEFDLRFGPTADRRLPSSGITTINMNPQSTEPTGRSTAERSCGSRGSP